MLYGFSIFLRFLLGLFVSSASSSSSSASASSSVSFFTFLLFASCLACSSWSAARFPPQTPFPSLLCLFFSLSYLSMSDARRRSVAAALLLALRLPVEYADGVSFSLSAAACFFGAGVTGVCFTASSLHTLTSSRPMAMPCAGPRSYAFACAAWRISLRLLADGGKFSSSPG